MTLVKSMRIHGRRFDKIR